MKTKLVLGLLLIFGVGSPCAFAATNFLDNGVTWKVGYEGDYYPNDSQSVPAWTTWYTSGGTNWLSGAGTLVISNWGNAPFAYAEMDNLGWWNASTPSTVEVKARFTDYTPNPSAYSLGEVGMIDGTTYFHLTFWGGSVKFDDSSNFSVDTTGGFHTYRMTLSNHTASLYVDNSSIAALTSLGQSIAANRIFWGDASGSGGAGMSEWDYVRFTNDGSFVPISVPEPSVAALVLFGTLAGFRWSRRRAR